MVTRRICAKMDHLLEWNNGLEEPGFGGLWDMDEEQIEYFEGVFNGIMDTLEKGGYEQGWRNTIAVDLSIASHVLDWKTGKDLVNTLINEGLVTEEQDDEDIFKRFERIVPYIEDAWRGEDLRNYGIALNHWAKVNAERRKENRQLKLQFVVY